MNDLHSLVEAAYQTAKSGNWRQLMEEWDDSPILLKRCSRYSKPSSLWTFLHQAAYVGQDKACRLLISHGANPAAAGKDSRTPADVATQHSHTETAAMLRGALTGSLWTPSTDPDVLPASDRWKDAEEVRAPTDIYVAYGGAAVRIPKGTPHFVDSFGRVLVGWHGTFNPPLGMDAESLLD